MSQDRPLLLRAVFDQALLQHPSARATYLEDVYANHPTIKADVMRLLGVDREARSFLEHPAETILPGLDVEAPFAGTERFHVRRRLGAGGMGVVYEVHDRASDEIVALKTLSRTSAADVYRFKREFRSLADVAHPNLVCLYELFIEEERCFFTMELVNGVSFVDYVRASTCDRSSHDRLRHVLPQLVEGVSALHRRGKLHRDLKPSNILVTAQGRVVILDFGLIAERRPQDALAFHYARGGTPAYMSPEEAACGIPSEASDWYGVGATFYEALTGIAPFGGAIHRILLRKRFEDPPAPSALLPSVSSALSAVCMGLLHRDRERRLSGTEALRRLAFDAVSSAAEPLAPALAGAPFVGRHEPLQRLRDAFAAVTHASAATRCVYGPSGIGKSALVGRFLRELAGQGEVVVLAGRCYENESVPYKALDGVVDDLSRYLRTLRGQQIESLLPADVPALTRVFPVLLQVDAIDEAGRTHGPGGVNPLGLRRQAFDALRELLARLAVRRSLVIVIDDLQWADADSVVLLDDLLRPPDAPAMLTVLAFRSEEIASKPFLQALLDRAAGAAWSALSLDPLTDEDAGTLIGELLPSGTVLSDHQKRGITREAGGSPFVIEQLARYAGADASASRQAPTFAGMFEARLAALSAEARRFLETLAICARPMAPALVCDASGLARQRQSLIAMLRSSNFIRSSGSSERVETYHDRIREVLAAQIAPDAMRDIHARVARTLVERGSDDCEVLFEHYRGAGNDEQAAAHAGLAAAKAAAALAFDRAAFFYDEALSLRPAAAAAAAWREGRADALANAGRPVDAAEAYLTAAAGADVVRQIELQRRAAHQLLIGGHIDRGRALIRDVLASVGVPPPRSFAASVASLLWRRAQLRSRGLQFVTRSAQEIDRDALLRVDTCWSAATGLAMVDMIGTSSYSAQHLRMALDAGEPSRIARGMALEAAGRSASHRSRTWSTRLVEQSKALATNVGDPQAIATAMLADGILATTSGRWKTALAAFDSAVPLLRDRCIGVTWEWSVAQSLGVLALMYLGEFKEAARRMPPLLAHARSRSNRYLVTELCTRSNAVWLAADTPGEAEHVAVESIAQWSQKGFHRQHYSALLARVQAALYRGDAEQASRLVAEHEPVLRRSYLTAVQLIRIELHYMRARSALLMATAGGHSGRWLAIAHGAARQIARERMPWSDPIALLLKAGVASVEGDRALALTYLEDAAMRFDRADMKLHAAVARRRMGAVQDGAPGRDLQRQADAWMAGQHIKNSMAMARMLAPGFADD